MLTGGPFDLNADNGPLLLRVSVAMMCVSALGLCGRLLARRLMRQPILWDDWMIVLALVFSWTCSLLQIMGMIFREISFTVTNLSSGVSIAEVGRHVQVATPETLVKFFKLLYALNIVYPFAISSIKLSIILFYRRIFAVPSTVKPLMLIAIIVGAWCIAVVSTVVRAVL